MKFKLVIFDFDGTLADTFSWFLEASTEASRKYQFRQISPGEVENFRRLSTKEILRSLNIPWWKIPRIAEFMRKRMAQDLSGIKLFPGVDHLLEELSRNGVRIVIVSSNAETNIRSVLGPDLDPLIDHYFCGSSLFGKKKKIKSAMKRIGCAPEETICIGDEIRDIEAARGAGARSGSVPWGYADVAVLRAQRPDFVFSTMEEIGQVSLGL